MNFEQLKPNAIAQGPVFPEPVKIIAVVPMGNSAKVIAEGLQSGKVHQPVLSPEQIAALVVSPDSRPYDGDPARFRLGVE